MMVDIFIICLFLVGTVAIGYVWFRAGKKGPLSGTLIGTVVGVVMILMAVETSRDESIDRLLRCQLNEPVASTNQLYGFRITNKRMSEEKESSGVTESNFYIDVITTLQKPNFYVLKDVKVTEEFYNDPNSNPPIFNLPTPTQPPNYNVDPNR